MPSSIEKYLKIYADETISAKLELISHFDYVVVIPAYNEGEEFIANLLRIADLAQKPVLIIVIVNNPIDSCSKHNQTLCDKIRALGENREVGAGLTLISLGKSSVALGGPYALPSDQGVGRARKMGADWALRLIAGAKISCPLIFCTDADAVLPENYFEAGEKSAGLGSAAVVFPFVHNRPESHDLRMAVELYEHRLNLYVAGLKKAGSPYAYHTVGSALAIKAESYAQVRGFPCRPAGEDFYVLNKVRKVGAIREVNCAPLVLSSRVSDRVPFGTGPALGKILQANSIKDAKIFYHPQVFILLGELLAFAERSIMTGSTDLLTDLSLHKISPCFKTLRGADRLANNLKLRTSHADRLKAFHDWFDGFLTLKFIHNLREQGLPMCALDEL